MNNMIPRHVAFIMDGNGRWAKKRLLAHSAGHRAGAQTLKKIAGEAYKIGIKYVTVFAFSTENWSREPDEVNALMGLMREYIEQYIKESDKNDTKIVVIGDITRLDADLQERIAFLVETTRNKPGLVMVIALNYGGRDEIVRAAKKLCRDAASNTLAPDDIDEQLFASYLDTADIPEPDLIIRTSGELRLSNFLLWEAAYAEFYACDKLWPDFNADDLNTAVHAFQNRERRFGGR